MVHLHIDKTLQLRGADAELKDYLRSLLTFLNPLWEEAENFGRWKGNIPKFLTQYQEENEVVVIPRGLLIHLVEDLGRQFTIEDSRVAPLADPSWPAGKINLRPEDQEPAVETMLQKEQGFLSAAAGSGKTIMALELARRRGTKTLWLTHRKELKDQVMDRAEQFLDIPRSQIGVLHGQQWKLGNQLTIGMVPTLRRRDLTSIADYFGTVIIDEAHHIPSSTFLEVVGQFSARYVYGLTATAYRRDNLESIMFNAVGPVIARIAHQELFEEEHLIKPLIKYRATDWQPYKAETLTYHDFMESMVYAKERNRLIVEDVLQENVNPETTGIVLVERTKHAEILTSLLQQEGVACQFVVGSVDIDGEPGKKKTIPRETREKIISEFKEGKIKFLVATYDLLAEGFDHPPLNTLFLATPIKWRGTVIQAVGRVQRSYPGKTGAKVYDYVDDRIAMFARQYEARFCAVYAAMNMPVEVC